MPLLSSKSETIFRIEVTTSTSTRPGNLLSQLPSIGITQGVKLKIIDLYFLKGHLSPGEIDTIAQSLICDPVTNRFISRSLQNDRVAEFKDECTFIEVTYLPGVTDNTALELLKAVKRLGILKLDAVATGTRYEFTGLQSEGGSSVGALLHTIARKLLVNDVIQHYALTEIYPEIIQTKPASKEPKWIRLEYLSDAELLDLNRKRRLALNINELHTVQDYFAKKGRPATDAELETIAQTWSEHCLHKTFKAKINCEVGTGNFEQKLPDLIDSLIRTYLQEVTSEINAPWVRSAFVDNAGVIEFDDQFDLSFKVETHNHPSALEPFGGANTGVGGVIRDILGVSHRPIANTDVLCFGSPDLSYEQLPHGVLHPNRIRSGVIAGIEDYGNKLGIPTVSGAVVYHQGYISNPLVYCGSVGIGPRDSHPRQPKPGDHIILLGGRTGRDGLRGATFSSLILDDQTSQVANVSVQIGDPITEKGLLEVITRARDARLYHAITDCGAGGLSSAVGEMASKIGARVELEKVPLKYSGLEPWEIWLSEAQERMVLAIPPQRIPILAEICEEFWVEWSDIGQIVQTGHLQVDYEEKQIVNLENDFLHSDCPQLQMQAVIPGMKVSPSEKPIITKNENLNSPEAILLALLSHSNIASKQEIIRVYDHQVRGSTVISPLVGIHSEGPSDAVVLKPLETENWRGFVLANGINPLIGEVDPYAMAVCVVDESIRNAVAVGADPDRIALLDNFCWGNPHYAEILGALVRAVQGCCDAARYFRTPFISGKDSLNNEYQDTDGRRHSIPGTLLVSSIGIHPDIRRAVTMDLKASGDILYLVGDWQPGLAGSHALDLVGRGFFMDSPAINYVSGFPRAAREVYRSLFDAIHSGLVSAVHDLSEGGLGVTIGEMALAGRLGAHLDLSDMDPDPNLTLFAESTGCFLVEVSRTSQNSFKALFSELPCEQVGEVNHSEVLSVQHRDQTILRLPIIDLVTAFNKMSLELDISRDE